MLDENPAADEAVEPFRTSLARLGGIAPNTGYKLIREGHLDAVMIFGKLMIKVASRRRVAANGTSPLKIGLKAGVSTKVKGSSASIGA